MEIIEKLEGILGVGLIGTDVTLEGPLKKGYGGSFLVNYRYSTSGVLNKAGLVDVRGNPQFQDAALKLNLPTKNLGTFPFLELEVSVNSNWTIPLLKMKKHRAMTFIVD